MLLRIKLFVIYPVNKSCFEIVPRSAHNSTVVADGDRLEIVVAVGGG